MPSMPQPASSTMRSGSSTVQVFTRTPRSWARVDQVGADERVPRVQRAVAVLDRLGQAGRAVDADVEEGGGDAVVERRAPGRRSGRWNEETSTSSRQPVGDQLDHVGGHLLGAVEVGIVGPVLDLDVHDHAGAGVERLGQRGHVIGQLGGGELHDHPAVGQLGVVVDDHVPVGGPPGVELHRVGARVPGPDEGRDRVLGMGGRGASVGDDHGDGCGHDGDLLGKFRLATLAGTWILSDTVSRSGLRARSLCCDSM